MTGLSCDINTPSSQVSSDPPDTPDDLAEEGVRTLLAARRRARQDADLAEAFSQIAAARSNLRWDAPNAANRNLHHALDRIVTVAFSLLPEVTE